MSLGGGSAFPTFAQLNFQITNVASGVHDLVGFRRNLVGGAAAAIIRRDQNIANNGSVGTMDFAGVEAAQSATATITVGGLVGGETVTRACSTRWVPAVRRPPVRRQDRRGDLHGLWYPRSPATGQRFPRHLHCCDSGLQRIPVDYRVSPHAEHEYREPRRRNADADGHYAGRGVQAAAGGVHAPRRLPGLYRVLLQQWSGD